MYHRGINHWNVMGIELLCDVFVIWWQDGVRLHDCVVIWHKDAKGWRDEMSKESNLDDEGIRYIGGLNPKPIRGGRILKWPRRIYKTGTDLRCTPLDTLHRHLTTTRFPTSSNFSYSPNYHVFSLFYSSKSSWDQWSPFSWALHWEGLEHPILWKWLVGFDSNDHKGRYKGP